MKKRVVKKKRGNMETKKLIIFIVIALLVLVVIISFLPDKENSNPQDNVFNDQRLQLTCEEKCSADLNCLKACHSIDINKAIVAKDVNLCNNVNNLIKQYCVDNVYSAKALQENNPSLCNNIINQKLKQDCLSNPGAWKWKEYI